MNLFALGWKGWVEVRKAHKPPTAHCSEIQHHLDPASIPYWQRTKSVTLKQLCFKGGRFLLSLPRRRFAAITRLSCPQGSVIPIPPPLANRLLERFNQ